MSPYLINVQAGTDLERYFEEVARFPLLDVEGERALAERWRDSHDDAAARLLVGSHLRLVVKIARGFRGYGLPFADLIAEGNVAWSRRSPSSIRTAASGSRPTRCGGSAPPSRNTCCTTARS